MSSWYYILLSYTYYMNTMGGEEQVRYLFFFLLNQTWLAAVPKYSLRLIYIVVHFPQFNLP
jgi:hypothetical protein